MMRFRPLNVGVKGAGPIILAVVVYPPSQHDRSSPEKVLQASYHSADASRHVRIVSRTDFAASLLIAGLKFTKYFPNDSSTSGA